MKVAINEDLGLHPCRKRKVQGLYAAQRLKKIIKLQGINDAER